MFFFEKTPFVGWKGHPTSPYVHLRKAESDSRNAGLPINVKLIRSCSHESVPYTKEYPKKNIRNFKSALLTHSLDLPPPHPGFNGGK